MNAALYTAIATSGGRDRRAASSDGRLDVALALPKEMGGTGDGTNPEQMFAAGYAACFATSLRLVAGKMKLNAEESSVTAEVGLVPQGQGYGLTVTLRVELPDVLHGDTGTALVKATEQVCPYSNATRGNIPVNVVIE
jgi:osmotically inducible protein OsmC